MEISLAGNVVSVAAAGNILNSRSAAIAMIERSIKPVPHPNRET